MDGFKYYENFPEFYSHPFIKEIKDNSRWTVSGLTSLDDRTNKKPIDIWELHDIGTLHGAREHNSTCLMTLDELLDFLPNAANHAYYLEAMEDEYVILDIEPDCPQQLKNMFLDMDYVYGETSMSGKGYHLVFPLPLEIDKYPKAKTKKVWQDKTRYFELHLEH